MISIALLAHPIIWSKGLRWWTCEANPSHKTLSSEAAGRALSISVGICLILLLCKCWLSTSRCTAQVWSRACAVTTAATRCRSGSTWCPSYTSLESVTSACVTTTSRSVAAATTTVREPSPVVRGPGFMSSPSLVILLLLSSSNNMFDCRWESVKYVMLVLKIK